MGRLLGAAAALISACGIFVVGARAVDQQPTGTPTPIVQWVVVIPQWSTEGPPDGSDVVVPIDIPYGDDHRIFELPAASVVPWPEQLTEDQVELVLERAGWAPELWGEAKAVAWCESRWSPGAIGDHGASVGLFQLNKATWFKYAGEDPEQWDNPVVNARVAMAAYRYSSGWAQWTCKP